MDLRCDRCQEILPSLEPGGAGGQDGKVVCPKCGHAQSAPDADASLDDELGMAFDNVLLQEGEADPASVEWFVAIEGQQVGPVSFADVHERWVRGVLGPDSLCWRAGLSDWVRIGDLPELAGRLPSAPEEAAAPVVEAPKAEVPVQPQEALESASAPEPKEPDWEPSAASALESLVEREMEEAEKRQEADPAIPDPETTGIRVVLRDLPPPPPPEPSKFIPIPKSVPAPAPAPAPRIQRPVQTATVERKGSRAPLFAALAAVLVIGGGAAAYFGGLIPMGTSQEPAPSSEAPAPVVARAEEPPPSEAKPAEPKPTEPEKEAVAEAEEDEAAAEKGEGGSDDGAAVAEAESESEEVEAPAEPPARTPAKSAPRRTAPEPKRQAVARPAPSPKKQAEAPRPTGGQPTTPKPASRDLLAAGKSNSIDALFEKEMSAPAPVSADRKTASSDPYIPPPPGSGVQKPRQLGQGDIMSVVASHRSELRGCASRYKEQGGGSGSVVMSWVIEPDGKTSAIKAVKGKEHAGMVKCLEDQIRRWKFPSYSGPRMEPIEFPFQF